MQNYPPLYLLPRASLCRFSANVCFPTTFSSFRCPNVISPSRQRGRRPARRGAPCPPLGTQSPLKPSKNAMYLQVLFLYVFWHPFGAFLMPKWSPKCSKTAPEIMILSHLEFSSLFYTHRTEKHNFLDLLDLDFLSRTLCFTV